MARRCFSIPGCTDALVGTRLLARACVVERVTGLEPALSAWEERDNHPIRSRPVPYSAADLRIHFSLIPEDPLAGQAIPDGSPAQSPARPNRSRTVPDAPPATALFVAQPIQLP